MKRSASNTTNFKEWAYMNTNLADSTIRIYNSVINRFFRNYDELTLDSVNKFILEVTRSSSSRYVRSALKQLFIMEKKPEEMLRFVKCFSHPRKKMGVYLKEFEIERIISMIEKPKHRLIAMIQYDTGARASDVISLKTDNIDTDAEGDTRIMMRVKGGKSLIVHLRKKTAEILEKYKNSENGRVFCREGQETNEYKYYRESLIKAAVSAGHPAFRSHDFRRNLIENAKKKGFKTRDIQKLVGHLHAATTERYFSESGIDRKDMLKEIWGEEE